MTPAPHRLVLSAGEFAYLVETAGVELPPDWMPADVADRPCRGRADQEEAS